MSIIGSIGSAVAGDASTTVTAAGSTLDTATQLISGFCVITTATSLQGVKLQAGLTGDCQVVYNNTGVSIKVYPSVSTSRINQIAIGGAMVLADKTLAVFYFVSSTLHACSLSS